VILDSSAVIAILLREAGFESLDTAIVEAEILRISSATLVEISIVVDSRAGEAGTTRLERYLRSAGVLIEPFTEYQARVACRAYSKYGKGRHAAGLNFGDCFSYALAKALDEPLLFKGDDFRKTDITPAIA
jgi:ribonuclease VapC